jgi:hypothetical protein
VFTDNLPYVRYRAFDLHIWYVTPGLLLGIPCIIPGNRVGRSGAGGTTARGRFNDRVPSRTRLQAAGLSDERIQWHLDAGTVRLDGEVVTDPTTPAPWPARIVLWSS